LHCTSYINVKVLPKSCQRTSLMAITRFL
jgi:hypothetical protein